MKDGSVGWNPGKLNPNIVKPAGPIGFEKPEPGSKPRPIDSGGYFDHTPHGIAHDFRREAITMLPERQRTVVSLRFFGGLTQEQIGAMLLQRNLITPSQLDAAIEHLSEVRGLPALDKALTSADRRYEASVRAKLDYGAVPFTMRVVMFWVNEWHRESDWYTWTLQP